MKIRTKRILLAVLLAAGIFWDALCLAGMIPAAQFSASLALICGFSPAISLIPILFPILGRADEKSTYCKQLLPREKALSAATLSLGCVWVATVAACMARL
jgi:hypothetical protein